MTSPTSNSTTTTSITTAPPPLVPITAHHHLPIKLTQQNYSSWRAHLIALLTGHDLLGYIDGSLKKPTQLADGSNAVDVMHWIRQDNLLLAAIFGSLSAEILPLVSSATSSCEAWSILTRLCAGRSRTRVNQLKSDLYRVEIKDRTITQYLHHVKAKADELALIDEPVSIDDLTLFVINGLGPEYATIVGPIRTRETPLRYEELHDLLFAHEQNLKMQENSQCSLLATANAATSHRGSSSSGRGFHRGGFRNNNSNRHTQNFGSGSIRGHSYGSNQNRNNNNFSRVPQPGIPPPTNRSSIICQLCGFVGHAAPTCRRRINVSANYASPDSSSPTNPWLVDSGASHNLTSNLHNLSIHSEYDGTDEVHIADGTALPISHTGKSVLKFPARSFILDDVLCVPSAK